MCAKIFGVIVSVETSAQQLLRNKMWVAFEEYSRNRKNGKKSHVNDLGECSIAGIVVSLIVFFMCVWNTYDLMSIAYMYFYTRNIPSVCVFVFI